jgi:hypothetical protein
MAKLDRVAEEKWCDDFATALLMPKSMVMSFTRSLSDWLRLADEFQVSSEAASFRAWQCSKKLLIQSNQAIPTDYVRRQVASEIFSIAELLTKREMEGPFVDECGTLSTGEQFVVRMWSDGHFVAVADCLDRFLQLKTST